MVTDLASAAGPAGSCGVSSSDAGQLALTQSLVFDACTILHNFPALVPARLRTSVLSLGRGWLARASMVFEAPTAPPCRAFLSFDHPEVGATPEGISSDVLRAKMPTV